VGGGRAFADLINFADGFHGNDLRFFFFLSIAKGGGIRKDEIVGYALLDWNCLLRYDII
jgi:hypothetical protein